MTIFVEVLIAFLLKMADNALSTVKTIYLTKGKAFAAALFAALSSAFYFVAIVRVVNSNSTASIVAMCFATFLGTILPCLFLKKSERDKLYIFDVTAHMLDDGKKFADILRSKNIAVTTASVYGKNMEKTLMCKIYCSSKEESKIVQNLLNQHNEFKYHIYVPIEDE